MANVKKYTSPVKFMHTMEEAVKKKVESVTLNKTDWINQAIKEKLEREEK